MAKHPLGMIRRMPSITPPLNLSHPLRAAAATALLALALAACVSRPATEMPRADAAWATAPVLLVSIDAFRADYLELGITPNLARIAREGARAQWMNPSYPALTFPNHYTMITGLRPDRHGIIHNTMEDAGLGTFKLSDRAAVSTTQWWGGEPIWVSAADASLPTATMFWPGSEALIGGRQPGRWLVFDKAVAAATRVDTVLGWLGERAATRPRLATLYFDALDAAGHGHGPDSPEAHAAIRDTDAAIGRLIDGLEARALLDAVNIVIVSDHGMATVGPGHTIAVEDMVDPADAVAVTGGQSVGFAPLPGRTEAAERRLLGAHPHYECWRKGELPARWHYGQHPRVPPIVCQMHEGWDAVPRARLARRVPDATRGSHGFDPALPSMRALFVARGPAFRRGVVLPAFDNVDVYPLLARLVGIAAAENDGDADAMAALKPDTPL